MDKEKIIKAGKIASEIKAWIKPQIKKDMLLLDIANLIEDKIFEMGAEPAFPVNLSINEYAAHYTPSHNDETKAHGLLKIDFGVSVDGWIADNAFSIDLENSELNKKLIKASEAGLKIAQENIKFGKTTGEIGTLIQKEINSFDFNPIANLTGHSMEEYDLHSGMSIPNIKNDSTEEFVEGIYAVEPFATNGNGLVHDGQKGNIFMWIEEKNTRMPFTREILEYIKDHYGPMPFASRWLVEDFGTKALLALRQLEQEGIVHHYPILTVEKGKIVSQAENTFLVEKDKTIITSE